MARSGFILNMTATDTSLPDARTYDERLGQRTELLGWYVPDAARVTQEAGRVAALSDRSSAAKNIAQPNTGKQPLLNASVAGINNRPSMTFDQTRGDYLVFPGVVPTGPSATWSKVVLLKPQAEATTFRDIMSGGSAATGLHRFAIKNTNMLHSRVGTAGTQAQAQVAYTPDAWAVCMATWDGPSSTTKVSINGGAWVAGTAAGAVCSDAGMAIGGVTPIGGFGGCGDIADPLLWGVDLSAAANATLLASVKQYFRDRYSLTVA